MQFLKIAKNCMDRETGGRLERYALQCARVMWSQSVSFLFRCAFKKHEPNRSKVRLLEGDVHVGRCLHCDSRILRIGRDNWVRIWPWQWGRYKRLKWIKVTRP
jgi:hypothetical protein